MKKSRKAAVSALCLVAAVLGGCSSTGGAPRSEDGGATAGGVDTPRYVVAMVTHGAPGDTYWDLVRKGAEDAANKDNIELRYSSDPQAPNQANLVRSAIDANVDGIAVTLPNAEAIGPVAAFTAWNFPAALVARKIAPALAADDAAPEGTATVGRAADDLAALIAERAGRVRSLGVSWGQTVQSVVAALDSLHPRPTPTVLPLVGGHSALDQFDSGESVLRVLASRLGATPRAATTTALRPPSIPRRPRSSKVNSTSFCDTASIRCLSRYGMPKFHIGTPNSTTSARWKRSAKAPMPSQAARWSGVSACPPNPAYLASIAAPSKAGNSVVHTSSVSTVAPGCRARQASTKASATSREAERVLRGELSTWSKCMVVPSSPAAVGPAPRCLPLS